MKKNNREYISDVIKRIVKLMNLKLCSLIKKFELVMFPTTFQKQLSIIQNITELIKNE